MRFILESIVDIEEKAVYNYAQKHKIPVVKGFIKEIQDDDIPVGGVDFFLKCSGLQYEPCYYPEFAKEYLHRNVWKETNWPLGKKVFIKPADKVKRFNGRVTDGSYKGKKRGPYWCSDIISFTSEWRYYVNNGEVVYVAWYMGEKLDPPKINLNFPSGWCGSVDMGLSNGIPTLIETGEPHSTGWYGTLENGDIYAEWIIAGYTYLKNMLR